MVRRFFLNSEVSPAKTTDRVFRWLGCLGAWLVGLKRKEIVVSEACPIYTQRIEDGTSTGSEVEND